MISEQEISIIKKNITKKVQELLENDKITEVDDLTSLGLDSIRSIELIVDLEADFDITFEDSELLLDNFKTIEKIEEMIHLKKGLNR
jgi:acyl carrier protein